jgi:hypothetical protein
MKKNLKAQKNWQMSISNWQMLIKLPLNKSCKPKKRKNNFHFHLNNIGHLTTNNMKLHHTNTFIIQKNGKNIFINFICHSLKFLYEI